MVFSRVARFLPYLLAAYLSLPVFSALLILPSVTLAEMAELMDALLVSLLSASVTTVISAILGVPLAYMLARKRSKLNQAIEALIVSPIVLPPIVTGLLLLSVLSPGGLIGRFAEDAGFQITRTLLAIVLAQLAVASPFTVISAKAAFEGVDVKLEFASRLMGAGRLKTFFKISLPLAKKGILAGLLMTFVRSVGEFGATFMVAYFPKTLPIHLYTSYLKGGVESAVPVAIVLWLIGVAVFMLIRILGDEIAGAERGG